MPKTSRGGKRTTSVNPTIVSTTGAAPVQNTAQNAPPVVTPTPTTPPTPAQIMQGITLPTGGVPFAQFKNMTDDQKADVITKALGVSLPFFLDDSGLQKVAYFTGMNDKPQVVSESALKAMPGQDLWRSVTSNPRANYSSSADIAYSGKDIYKQIATGDYTMYSDRGGSVHGKGIYFDNSKGSYGSGSGYTIIHAKVAPGAKIINESTLQSRWNSERRAGTKLARAISNADNASQQMLYALAKGYDVVNTNYGYHMFINRKGMAISDTTF